MPVRSRGVCAARWDEGGSEAAIRFRGVREGVLEMCLGFDGVESMAGPVEGWSGYDVGCLDGPFITVT